ncbi:Cpe/LpqF family protein [Microbacterium sp. KSW4-16]|uniref:Cpe/LpqF family protein n=1 Tax=Microbacterium aurugineum TaxID=2851642 RepID=UPI00200B492D|nr:Cpe/LpqF family protein [Microbacterium aurugineum]MCK8469050.1 Cpe/LpqF family protein [Microbacterium aurugineum]
MLALIIALSGCSTDAGVTDKPAATSISFPQTDLGQQSMWVVEQLESGASDTSEWEERMSQQLTAEVSPEALAEVLQTDIAPRGPFVLESFEEKDSRAVAKLIDASNRRIQMTLSLDPADGTITGLYFN